MKHIIQLLTEETMDQLYEFVFADKEYVQLEREYHECFAALEKAVPKEKRKCFLNFEAALNAVSEKELEVLYQKGLRDGIVLMRSLWK